MAGCLSQESADLCPAGEDSYGSINGAGIF